MNEKRGKAENDAGHGEHSDEGEKDGRPEGGQKHCTQAAAVGPSLATPEGASCGAERVEKVHINAKHSSPSRTHLQTGGRRAS